MKASEILIKGRDFLQAHKWGRGDYELPNGSYCAIGALHYGVDGGLNFNNRDTIKAEQYLQRAIREKVGTFTGVTVYNDTLAKRKRDVISRFNEAIKLALKENA